jgi:hypothetical protein
LEAAPKTNAATIHNGSIFGNPPSTSYFENAKRFYIAILKRYDSYL